MVMDAIRGVSKHKGEFMNSIKISRFAVLVGALIATFVGGNSAFATNNTSCLDPKKFDSYKLITMERGAGAITTRDGKPLCSDGNLVYQSFNLPATWKGTLVWDKTAIPQTEFGRTATKIPANTSNYVARVTVPTPEACKGTQMDWNLAPGVTRIDTLDGDAHVNIFGELFVGKGNCEAPAPEVKKIPVCELTTKTKVTIEESKFDSKKYSKTVSDCDTKPAVTKIPVCEIDTKTKTTIEESKFDSKKYSKTVSDCDTKPSTPEAKPEAAETKQATEVTELPHTGIADLFGGGIGLGAIAAATTAYVRSRRS